MSVQATCTRGSLKCSSASQLVISFETLRTLELSLKSHLNYKKNWVQIDQKVVRTNFFLTVYMGYNQVWLMIEKRNSTHAQNHCEAWQARIKKMVPNKDVFTQCFQTAKGVRTHFFFRFWGHRRLWFFYLNAILWL